MPILQIEHTVRDYDEWKRAFDGDPVGRERGGVRSYRVLRAAEDPNQVSIDLEFDSMADAEAFQASLRALWERVGGNLGLESRRMRIVEVVESREYAG